MPDGQRGERGAGERADERLQRAHAERDELRNSLGAALTQIAAEREAAERP